TVADGIGHDRAVPARRSGVHRPQRRPPVQVHGSDIAGRELRDAEGGRRVLEQAGGRRPGIAVRLAEGQVRPVLAGRPFRLDPDAGGHGSPEVEAGHAGDAPDEEDRHRPPRAGLSRMTGRGRWLTRVAVASALSTVPAGVSPADGPGRYASVNGLKMYYEVHGAGPPLVLLHGAFLTVDAWGKLLPELARSRQVIAPELQGHGRTADVDRPLSFRQMAEDVAALLREIKIEHADVYGYSMGGTVALALASRHPALVRKLIVQGSTYNKDGWEPEAFKQFSALPPDFAPKPLKDPYDKVAPDPKHWPVL